MTQDQAFRAAVGLQWQAQPCVVKLTAGPLDKPPDRDAEMQGLIQTFAPEPGQVLWQAIKPPALQVCPRRVAERRSRKAETRGTGQRHFYDGKICEMSAQFAGIHIAPTRSCRTGTGT